MTRALVRIASLIDRVTVPIGRASSLLLPLLMAVIVLNVGLRYGLDLGFVEFEELQWHINAIVVLGCLAYAYRDDAHVRVDVWHSRFSTRRKAWIELIGGLVLLLPFVIGVAWFAWGNFVYSYSIGEGSPMPSGLPARYVIKFVLFAGFVLLGLQGIAAILRSIRVLNTPPRVSRQKADS
ncbi:TRAP transporter small permease subunit [Microbaculum sp. FT89]|uniref:TRAP transporter small permease subunit n=1 Tax=Microbaculum sp. FT89 TaxID=3447298 RepID=UPI003F52ED1C